MATERKARASEETAAERRARRMAMVEELSRRAKELEAVHGPDPTNSVDLIREAREERTRELMERAGEIPVGDDAAWERALAFDREVWEAGGRWVELERAALERADAERQS